MSANVKIFVEGPTDKTIIEKLTKEASLKAKIHKCKGKRNINSAINKIVIDPLPYPPQPDEPTTILIFRDRDGGETQESICKSINDNLKNKINTSERIPPIQHQTYSNIYKFYYKDIYLTTILHISERQGLSELKEYIDEFSNAEIEDYILAGALEDRIISRFSIENESRCEFDQNIVKKMIVSELPLLLKEHGVNPQQKDILSAYMFATRFLYIKRSDDEKCFISILMDRIIKHGNHKEVFASIIEALEMAVNSPELSEVIV